MRFILVVVGESKIHFTALYSERKVGLNDSSRQYCAGNQLYLKVIRALFNYLTPNSILSSFLNVLLQGAVMLCLIRPCNTAPKLAMFLQVMAMKKGSKQTHIRKAAPQSENVKKPQSFSKSQISFHLQIQVGLNEQI